MAPGYRNANRRQNRTGYVDHDQFEGLPVRHWRRDYVTVAPPPSQDNSTSQNDIWAVELPHGMPKDYHLLPQHSQDLLRGARSGRIYKRPPPIDEDEVDAEGIIGDKPEKKEEETKDRGFSAKAWKQVPRHLEGPDIEYLAKRRKTVVTIGSKAPKPIPTVTKAKLKKVDAAGNEYIQDVIVPHGQAIVGEVISQVEIPDPSAAATLAQPSPTKRKPVTRKKTKGPGRGRKKKPLAPTSVPISTEAKPAATVGTDGVKIEGSESLPPQSEDTEMRDGSATISDEESSDEGEEGDDDEDSIEHASPSKASRRDSGSLPPLPNLNDIPNLAPEDTPMSGLERPMRPSLHHLNSEPKSGSPLKNVALTTSTLPSPSEASQSAAPFAAPVHTEESVDIQGLDEQLQQQVTETAPSFLPSVPLHPTEDLVQSSAAVLAEELEEEDMLLDLNNSTHVNIKESGNPVAQSAVLIEDVEGPPELPQIVEPEAEAENSDDDFPDLLGDLEKSLGDPAAVPEGLRIATSLEQHPSSDSDLTIDDPSNVEQ